MVSPARQHRQHEQQQIRAIGAVVARFVHTEEVTGSNPVSPTKSTGDSCPRKARTGSPSSCCAAALRLPRAGAPPPAPPCAFASLGCCGCSPRKGRRHANPSRSGSAFASLGSCGCSLPTAAAHTNGGVAQKRVGGTSCALSQRTRRCSSRRYGMPRGGQVLGSTGRDPGAPDARTGLSSRQVQLRFTPLALGAAGLGDQPGCCTSPPGRGAGVGVDRGAGRRRGSAAGTGT